jgi:hypothetical protein
MAMTNCLFLKASAAACANEEGSIRANLKGLGVDMEVIEWVSVDDFLQQAIGKKFSIIYLGAHADNLGFGEEGLQLHRWEELGVAICASECMLPEGTLFLGCCRGGMKIVALKILQQCDKIDYIFGPNWNTKGGDLVTAFTTYIRNRLTKAEEPCVAAKRASEATGQNFTCYDRQELDAEIEFLRKFEGLEFTQQFIVQQQNQVLKKVELVTANITEITKLLKESRSDPEPTSGRGDNVAT